MYDVTYQKPAALLERYDTFEVHERSLADGSVLTLLDENEARKLARVIGRQGYEAVAVAFLHAYVAPQNELRMKEILIEEVPGLEVSVSHELSREYREYERTSTTVLDAYIKPIMRKYLTELSAQLNSQSFDGQFFMSRSGGGAMTAVRAREEPVNLILSGPAGGVVGAAGLSKLIDRPNLITIDMGGTSLDASLVLDGEPIMYHGAEFEGLPINTPSLYIHTIGAGGGSIAYLDEAGALQVGPKSAGADPGPAAYGRGGTQPTFTDAALAVGYLGTDTPLGGTLTLDADKASAALRPLADALGYSVEELARGVLNISTTKIMGAVRAITIELGHDPKEFSLLSFGGGGGLVAVDVARELGIPEVVIPPGQGAFSALGMLMADVQHDLSRTTVFQLDSIDMGSVEQKYAHLEADAVAILSEEGFSTENMKFDRSIQVRYFGQEHSVTIPFPDGPDIKSQIEAKFKEVHERQYGHVLDDPIEVTNLRLKAIGIVDKPKLPKSDRRRENESLDLRTRKVAGYGESAEKYQLVAREDLRVGDSLNGPLIVTEHTATTVIHAGDRLEVGTYGELIISLNQAPNSAQSEEA
ncbi:5-oxoprolinase [Brevibacterium casei S18]|uniref:5-oxoprolinase n=2 Tax=Brevibacterium casei TaxID=33889 RepID=K9AJN9_9MICO|nr:5-oxoprolinase [Brevibacterium casei S18]